MSEQVQEPVQAPVQEQLAPEQKKQLQEEFVKILFTEPVAVSLCAADVSMICQGLRLLAPFYTERLQKTLMDPQLSPDKKQEAIQYARQTMGGISNLDGRLITAVKPQHERTMDILKQLHSDSPTSVQHVLDAFKP